MYLADALERGLIVEQFGTGNPKKCVCVAWSLLVTGQWANSCKEYTASCYFDSFLVFLKER